MRRAARLLPLLLLVAGLGAGCAFVIEPVVLPDGAAAIDQAGPVDGGAGG